MIRDHSGKHGVIYITYICSFHSKFAKIMMNNRIGPMVKYVWNFAMCMLSELFVIPKPQQLTTLADTVVHLLILKRSIVMMTDRY